MVFAHGSGSSRRSPRNRYVAELLDRAGLGTLLFDLLTAEEEHDRANVFDIPLLAQRLRTAPPGCAAQPGVDRHAPGLLRRQHRCGRGAVRRPPSPTRDVAAVVSRGGRPDLAGPRLP